MDFASGFHIGGSRELPHRRSRRAAALAGLAVIVAGHLFCARSVAEPATTETAATSTNAASAGTILLSGEIRNPGPLQIAAGEQITVSGAILKAGGLGAWGNGEKVKLMRQKNGVTETTIVNYDKVIKTGDAKNDPVLQAGDRIFVPEKGTQF